jgi:hypothetical protein
MEDADFDLDATSPAESPEPDFPLYFNTKVPACRTWRSLGGYLDYDFWTERERFVQLDQAIQAQAIADSRLGVQRARWHPSLLSSRKQSKGNCPASTINSD